MRHQRYRIADLTISGREIRGPGGDLVVARRADDGPIDWELVYRSSTPTTIEPSPYDLAMRGPGADLSGPAILVRSDGRSHVFRGAGDLEGFDPGDLRG